MAIELAKACLFWAGEMSATKPANWTRRLSVLAAFAVCLAALTGCETPAQRLEPSAVNQIQERVTTRQEVLQTFGQPQNIVNGRDRTLYLYSRNFLPRRDAYGPTEDGMITVVSVLFGPDDRVLRKHHSFHKVNTIYTRSGPTFGSDINADTIAKVRPGLTTRQEAENLLGEPASEWLDLDGRLVLEWIYIDARRIGGGGIQKLHVWFDDANIAVAAHTYDSR